MTTTFDLIHAWAVRTPALHAAALLARVLLALAFVPSGLVKILDEPFTQLPTSDPVGYFFAGFFSAHAYYRFVGAAQWIAAALLLVPRTVTLGAFVYLPIIVNIFAITIAIGPSFAFTRVITGGMLLANLYLLAWDWDRWRHLVRRPVDASRYGSGGATLALLAAAAIGGMGVAGVHLARLTGDSYLPPLVLTAAGTLLGVFVVYRSVIEARRIAIG